MSLLAPPGRLAALAILSAISVAGCGDNGHVTLTPDASTGDAPTGDAGPPPPSSDEICNAPTLSTVLTPVPKGGGNGGPAAPINVKVHYNRPDGVYTDWGLHVWQINDAGQTIADYPGVTFQQPLLPAGSDAYGPFFAIEASKFTAMGAAGFGFIVHNGDTKDPDGDRLWKFSDGAEFWLKSGDATIYRTDPSIIPDIATVHVHYKRFDANYAVWGLHLFTSGGIDATRLPGLTINDFANPVPLSAMPGYTAAYDGSEVTFDLPVQNPKDNPGLTALEFIIHGTPDNPGGVSDKDGWSDNIHVAYAGLTITSQVGEIWLVQETPQVFTAPPNTQTADAAHAVWLSKSLLRWPRVNSSGVFRLYHSATGQIVARQGAPVSGADGALPLAVSADALPPDVAERFKFVGTGVNLTLAQPGALDAVIASQLVVVQEDAAGNVLGATTTQIAGLLDDRFGAATGVHDLGVSVGTTSDQFKLWAPTAQKVSLCTYSAAAGVQGRAVDALTTMTRDPATGVWSATVTGDHTGQYYRYAVEVFVRGVGVVRNLVTDPYSISLDANSQHSYIADLGSSSLKPTGWDADVAPNTVAAQEDMTIYELHVRDFSANDSTVPAGHRGKFLAFTDDSAGMQHLRGLAQAGVTDIHLLPVFDIATIPELGCQDPVIPNAAPDAEAQQAAIASVKDLDCFNWGYDPFHYTAPEGSYASDPDDGASRVREMRAMVMALHGTGLRVGMDVVYNHTTASGQDDKSVLDRIVPGYYHRLDANGAVETSTCCQNTAAENLMMGKLMIDSAVTWATQYKIDSFRFDLMSFHPRATMEQLKTAVEAATLRSTFLIGEGWNFGEIADGSRFVQASQLSLGGSGIGTFSDRARDFLRGGGPFDGGASLVQNQGFTNGLFYDDNGSGGNKTRGDLMHAADIVKIGLAGSIRDYPLVTSSDQTLELQQIDYNGQPAGYVSDPQEVVNYIENHDNQTLFDNNVYKLPTSTSADDRARVQLLGAALIAFSQGVAYFHAGVDTLRSKSMDQNSFNSGDWFNKLDWSYQDNNFGAGAPQQGDNGNNWSIIKPLLANPAIKPPSDAITFTRDAFRDLLAIRKSSQLFHLRTGDDIKQRLTFYNTGSQQEPTVIAGHLDGRNYPQAEPSDLMYFVNVDKVAHTLTIAPEKNKPYVLHPVHLGAGAADPRPAASASYDAATGAFTIPPRTTVVFVAN